MYIYVNTTSFNLYNPTKEGYTFKGWGGTELEGDENLNVRIFKNSTGDREYTANFVPISYTIRFFPNSGTGSMPNMTLTYDVKETLTENVFKRAGYKFLGWNTLADGTGIFYEDKQEVLNLVSTSSKSVYLYAQWERLPTRYAVQIYGINQDVDENDNVLGLTFGPATKEDYNNAYVTHRYVANDEGTYNIEIITTTVDAYGSEEIQTIETLLNSNDEPVTRTEEQVAQRQNINLHEMTWEEIASVSDKTLFEDCMLCGDTKTVSLTWNEQLKSGTVFNQYGAGAGTILRTVKNIYRRWNQNQEQDPYVGSAESGVILTDDEITYGSNARSAGGYSSSHIRATLIGENEKTNRGYAGEDNLTPNNCVYSCIEEELRENIVPKKVKYVTGENVDNYLGNDDIADSIWLFSEKEVNGTGDRTGGNVEGIGEEGTSYLKFSNIESRNYMEIYTNITTNLRIAYNEVGEEYTWYLRSPYLDIPQYVGYVNLDGRIFNYSVSNTCGLSFGFCLR